MASLDVDSLLFADIPLEWTIYICLVSLYNDNDSLKIPQELFKSFSYASTKESFVMLNNEFFKQIDAVAMASP